MNILMLIPDNIFTPAGGVGVQIQHLLGEFPTGEMFNIVGAGGDIVDTPAYRYRPLLLNPILPPHPVMTVSAAYLLQAAYTDVGWHMAMEHGFPDIVWATDTQTFMAGILLARRFDVPLVITIQLSYALMALSQLEITQLDQATAQQSLDLELAAIAEATAVINVSRDYQRRWQLIAPQYAHKMHLIPNGVPKSPNTEPISFGEGFHVGYIGRCTHQKGVQFLLQAIASDSWPDRLTLHWAGNDNAGNPELWQVATAVARQYPERLKMHGFLSGDEKWAFLRGCDMGIVPSVHEPFGIVGLEWMAAGTLLATTGANGIRDYANETNALFFEPSAEGVLSVTNKVIKGGYHELTTEGMETAKAFDWDNIARMYVDIFETVAEVNRVGTPSF